MVNSQLHFSISFAQRSTCLSTFINPISHTCSSYESTTITVHALSIHNMHTLVFYLDLIHTQKTRAPFQYLLTGRVALCDYSELYSVLCIDSITRLNFRQFNFITSFQVYSNHHSVCDFSP